MPFYRRKWMLQLFAFTYGPIKGELRGMPMTPGQWKKAYFFMAFTGFGLLFILARETVDAISRAGWF